VTGHVEQVYRLMAEADGLPDGPVKVTVVEQAAAVADSHRDAELAFQVRKTLLGVCLSADQSELMLVAFAWCLAQCDRDPERFPIERILWEFRWVVSSLCTFPEVSRAKIDEMKAEMARRYQQAGAGPRSFCLMCRKMGVEMGDVEAAAAANAALRGAPVDWLSDGYPTELGFEISYRLFRNEPARALKAAGPFLSREIRSDHFEGQACADVLLPMLKQGRAAEAMASHRRGYRLRSRNIRHLDSIAKHIAFLALTDNLGRAVRLFEKHLPDALRTSNAFNRMRFLIDTVPLLDRLRKAGREANRLRVPAECPLAAGGERPIVSAVREWVRTSAGEWAAEFDTRNGNDYYARRLAAAPHLQRLFAACPLNP
jgi:hypothetical protein